ncbi:porin family protein [Sphingomonas sp.]|uniref:porin family protein n=1 Tax=Sphingomonas sp. TaxID=28214 RepID=UPI0025F7A68F|nr:porin family protein [Sphingomonas sp.]
MKQAAKGLLLAATLFSPALAHAEAVAGHCVDGVCRVTLTADQLLAKASQLVAERQFDQARPMVAALSNVAAFRMQTHFLTGFIAVETGDTESAVREFRAALVGNPGQTRIRLELARALMMQGNRDAADYNFRLAEQDAKLPPEIQATIRASRGLLRDGRDKHLSFDFGIAPDTNITNGTNAQTVDLVYGNQTVPLTLTGNARSRSGIGQTASLSAGIRHHVAENIALLADVDGQGVNYKGQSADDFTGQFSVGPEIKLSDRTVISLQGIASQRYYGGERAATQFGGRANVEHTLNAGQRVGLTIDSRHTASGFSPDYNGWTTGAYATYERVVMRSMVASASLFYRTERLKSKIYSDDEIGLNLGIGGELKHGINAGISGGISHASYKAPLLSLSANPRADWRYNARIYAGLRSVRVLGFSPSVAYTYSRIDSSMILYQSNRSRLSFNLARYF